MYDETFVIADFKQNPRQQFYDDKQRRSISKIFRYNKIDKFARKFMVWQGICSYDRNNGSKTIISAAKISFYQPSVSKKVLMLFKPAKFLALAVFKVLVNHLYIKCKLVG